jgi:hypothetical protein
MAAAGSPAISALFRSDGDFGINRRCRATAAAR